MQLPDIRNVLRALSVTLTLLLLVAPLHAADKAPAGKVDLNTADQKTLEGLPGVGAATAKAIIAARPFKSVDDLQHVKGIGDAKFASLKDKVTVGAAPSASALAAPAPAAKKEPAPAAAPAASAKPSAKAASSGPVDLNTADEKSLEGLPGVGPATAKAIIAARPFKSVDDLKKVKGIGDAKYATLKDKVTVGAGAPAPAAAPAAQPAASAPAAPASQPAPASAPAPAKSSARPAAAAAPKLAPGEKVNINTASKEKIEALPEIGPVKAQAIIDGRPYKTIEDVMKVKGIKQGVFGKIKDLIVVD